MTIETRPRYVIVHLAKLVYSVDDNNGDDSNHRCHDPGSCIGVDHAQQCSFVHHRVQPQGLPRPGRATLSVIFVSSIDASDLTMIQLGRIQWPQAIIQRPRRREDAPQDASDFAFPSLPWQSARHLGPERRENQIAETLPAADGSDRRFNITR
ncbi:MAG: hypothetical protein QF554_10995 [Dehalococcoidia bacterium]|nr:hypothetical protein [Dehalococcoidia bacterium]